MSVYRLVCYPSLLYLPYTAVRWILNKVKDHRICFTILNMRFFCQIIWLVTKNNKIYLCFVSLDFINSCMEWYLFCQCTMSNQNINPHSESAFTHIQHSAVCRVICICICQLHTRHDLGHQTVMPNHCRVPRISNRQKIIYSFGNRERSDPSLKDT